MSYIMYIMLHIFYLQSDNVTGTDPAAKDMTAVNAVSQVLYYIQFRKQNKVLDVTYIFIFLQVNDRLY